MLDLDHSSLGGNAVD